MIVRLDKGTAVNILIHILFITLKFTALTDLFTNTYPAGRSLVKRCHSSSGLAASTCAPQQ